MTIPANAPDGPLHFEDVAGRMKPVYVEDPNVQKSINEFNRKLMDLRIYRINTHYKEYQKIWPDGGLIDFFIGLQINHDDHVSLKQQFKKENFRELVKRESLDFQRKARINQTQINLRYETPQNTPEIDISPDDLKHQKGLSPAPIVDLSKWSKKNIDTFVKLVKEQFSNKEIGHKFLITDEQVEDVREQLNKKGLFTKKERKSKDKDSRPEKERISGFTFIKKGRKFRCGRYIFDPYDPDLNPLKGYIDDISQRPIKRPFICNNGYVLDYDTWYNIIYGKSNKIANHIHPYTGEKLGSLAALTELTIDNFDEYKDKIKNIDFTKEREKNTN